jgi:hypothetical protein
MHSGCHGINIHIQRERQEGLTWRAATSCTRMMAAGISDVTRGILSCPLFSGPDCEQACDLMSSTCTHVRVLM